MNELFHPVRSLICVHSTEWYETSGNNSDETRIVTKTRGKQRPVFINGVEIDVLCSREYLFSRPTRTTPDETRIVTKTRGKQRPVFINGVEIDVLCSREYLFPRPTRTTTVTSE